MAQVTSQPSLSNLQTLDEVRRYASIALTDIQTQVNGNIEFDKNIKSQTVQVNFTTADQDVSVSHSLGRVPSGFLVVHLSAPAIVYAGSVQFTDTTVSLRASGVCLAKVIII